MNKTANRIAIGLLGLSLIGSASARHGGGYYDKAKVTEVSPIYETVQVSYPEKQCWDEQVLRRGPGPRSYTGTIVGGIVGGVVGNQIGNGRGRDVATVAGTLLGASIGHDLSNRRTHYRTVTSRHCEVVERYAEEEHLVGYRVEYRYKGRTFVTRTDEHPGKWIRVEVDVEPVGRL
jgi:uncharacterized protein YcfJ